MFEGWSTLKKLIWLRGAAGGSGTPTEWKTVSGAAPLTLANAVRHAIRSLTQTGKCAQASTPTPSSPVDIKCNNGTLVARRQSGLPTGYQLLDWLGSTKSIETAIPTTNNTEIRAKWYRARNNAQYLYVSDSGGSLTTNTTAYLSRTGNWRFGSDWYALDAVDQTMYESIQNKSGIWLNGTKIATYTNVGTFTSETNLRLLGTNQYSDATQLYWLEHRESGVLVAKYLPVKQLSDNAYGFYDIIGNAFYTNAEATFSAGNAVDDPVEVVVVGTDEVLTVSASGTENQTASVVDLLGVGDDGDTQEIISGAIKRKCAVRVLDGTEDWSLAGTGVYSFQIGDANGTAWRKEAISTHYVGTDATTATMPSDSVKCATNAAGTVYSLYIKPSAYPSSSANTFKAYVAEQYAAGTPIIVVYPLVEEVTEQVAAQHLTTAEGTNTVSVGAEVSGITLEAVYKGVSS